MNVLLEKIAKFARGDCGPAPIGAPADQTRQRRSQRGRRSCGAEHLALPVNLLSPSANDECPLGSQPAFASIHVRSSSQVNRLSSKVNAGSSR